MNMEYFEISSKTSSTEIEKAFKALSLKIILNKADY